MNNRKLLTRQDIVKLWQSQPQEYLNSYCCPYCRDILHGIEDKLVCKNHMCKGTSIKHEVSSSK